MVDVRGSTAVAVGQTASGRPAEKGRTALVLFISGVALATVVAVIAGNGNLGVAIAPVLVVSVVYVMCRMPLRWTAALLLTLLLSLDVSDDASGVWHSPFVFFGDLLRANLDETLRIPGLKLTGMEVVLVFAFGIWLYRKITGSTIDGRGQVQTARPIRDAVVLYLALVAFAAANGVLTGGSLNPWQLRYLVHGPLLFVLFQESFRGPKDHFLIGRIVVFSAVVKAALAVWVDNYAQMMQVASLPYATNHGDSILFALALVILLAHFAERRDRRRFVQAVLLVPLLLWGTYANHRRLAWVDLAIGLATMYLLSPPWPWKRRIARFAMVATPIVLLYIGLGWTSGSVVFRPVATLRSLEDSKSDRSTFWRDVENWNMCVSMQERPLLGIGLGKEYREFVKGDDISSGYREFRFWPHNSVLGLLLFGGLFAFTGIWTLFAVGIFLAMRSFLLARVPEDRTAALSALCALFFCVIQAYGDLGPAFVQYRVFTGLALAVTGKLAVATGAWPALLRRRRGGAEVRTGLQEAVQ